jgi:hypothetical protein
MNFFLILWFIFAILDSDPDPDGHPDTGTDPGTSLKPNPDRSESATLLSTLVAEVQNYFEKSRI